MLKKILAVLGPSLERQNFVAAIADTKNILNDQTLAPFKTCVESKLFMGNHPFRTGPVVKLNSLVARHIRGSTNMIDTNCKVLSNLSAGWETFERIADVTIKGKTLDKVGISYRQGSILHMLNLIDFFCNYSRMLLLYTLSKEVREFKSMTGAPETFTKGEIAYLEKHAENWARCLEIFSNPMPKIMAVLDTVPDIVYDPKTEAAVQTQVGARLNPLNMGFVPVISDLFLFFGLRWAERKAKRLLKAEQERKALELRIAQYRAAAVGNPDAATDRLIEVTEEEVRDLNFEIAKMRKSMGVDE